MRHDLCQIKFRVHAVLHQMIDLCRRVGMRIGPSPKCQVRHALPDLFPELPGMLDTSRRSDALVAAKYNERLEPMIASAIGIRQTIINRMLAREKRYDAGARHVSAEIDHEMPEVVFFFRTDRAVGEKHKRAVARQRADRVIRVNPRVTARCRFEFGTRWTKLRG